MAKYKKKIKAEEKSVGGSIAQGATSGIGTGASVGSMIAPGIGTAIGAGVGALAGGVGGYFQGKNQEEQEEQAREKLQRQEELRNLKLNKQPGRGYSKVMNEGGSLVEYKEGGKHEENPLGGIPIGKNLVEEGETRDEDYIFSDSLKVNKTLAKEFNLSKKSIGKTFAEVSKLYDDKERPSDRISKRGYEKEIENLKKAQEAFKSVENKTKMRGGGKLKPTYSNKRDMVRNSEDLYPHLKNSMSDLSGVSDNKEMLYRVFDNLPEEQKKQYTERAFGDYYRQMQNGGPLDTSPMLEGMNYDMGPTADPAFSGYGNILPQDGNIPTRGIGSVLEGTSAEPTLENTNQELNTTTVDANTSFSGESDETSKKSGSYGSLLRYAPVAGDIANLVTTVSNKPEPTPESAYNTDMEFNPNFVDRSQIQRDIESQAEASRDTLVSNSNMPQSSLASNLTGNQLAAQKSTAQAQLQADLADIQEKVRAENMTYQQAVRNKANEMRIKGMNDKDAAAYETQLLDSISGLTQSMGNIGIDEANRQMAGQLSDYDMNRFFRTYYNKNN